MGVFQGGRTLEALELVCNGYGHLTDDVLEGIESLVGISLVQQREGREGEPRFWMLETIHEYSRDRLQESGEVEALRGSHAAYFLTFAEELAPQLQGPRQAETAARIEDDLDNLRAAIAWAFEHGEAEIAARVAGALWAFMWSRGYLSEGRRWLEAALENDTLSAPLRATALRACGILAHDQGDYARAEQCFEQALSLRRELGDKSGIAGALNALGVLLLRRGDYEAARPYYEEALTLFRELDDQARVSVALNNL